MVENPSLIDQLHLKIEGWPLTRFYNLPSYFSAVERATMASTGGRIETDHFEIFRR
jgi:hypothetical protein